MKIIYSIIIILSAIVYNASYVLSGEKEYKDDYGYSQFDRKYLLEGESLKYEAFLFGNLLPVGTAELNIKTVEENHKKYYLFKGNANGDLLGIKVSIDLFSYVDFITLRPEFSVYTQRGFKKEDRKLVFDWTAKKIIYYKNDKYSDMMIEKSKIDILPQTRDILSTLYFARDVKPEINYSKVMKFIEKGKYIWIVDVKVIDKKKITIRNGKSFDALKISLTPLNPKKKMNKIFQGLFGLQGQIILWVTQDSRIPLLIEGDYPLGIFTIRIQIVLQDWKPENLLKNDLNANQTKG